MFKTKTNKKWKVSEVGKKEKRIYMTKKRKAIKRKKEYGVIGLILGLAVVIIIGYGNIDEGEIGLNLKAKAQNGILYQVEAKNLSEGQILTNKTILEPTKEQVKEEIIRQSKLFSLSEEKMLALALCESGFNYKAKNPNSTARGVFQYLISTWEETESAKKGIERNDYKANIREAMIDISNGESWRWRDCSKKVGL
jgi:hypothetical protein